MTWLISIAVAIVVVLVLIAFIVWLLEHPETMLVIGAIVVFIMLVLLTHYLIFGYVPF